MNFWKALPHLPSTASPSALFQHILIVSCGSPCNRGYSETHTFKRFKSNMCSGQKLKSTHAKKYKEKVRYKLISNTQRWSDSNILTLIFLMFILHILNNLSIGFCVIIILGIIHRYNLKVVYIIPDFFFRFRFITLPASLKDELKLTGRVSTDTSSVGCEDAVCGFLFLGTRASLMRASEMNERPLNELSM